MLAGKAIRMAMSYVMHSFRPRLSLAAGREIMHFSKWILVTGLVTLVNRRGGTLLIAKFLDASSVNLCNCQPDLQHGGGGAHRADQAGSVPRLREDRA